MKYTHRYMARIILEAETALFVGSGESSLLKDALVQKDHHGFPMIQGSSLAGVLRHSLEDRLKEEQEEDQEQIRTWNVFFGYQKEKKGLGSKVRISSAYLLLPGNKVTEGLTNDQEALLVKFRDLPSRQHVRISDKGVAEETGLFENEVVYKGCRFIFEIEVRGDGSESAQWKTLLKQLNHPLFRLGQGTRNGYGRLKVESCKAKIFDLRIQNDFNLYLDFDPSLNADNECLIEEKNQYTSTADNLTHYQLSLKPDGYFFLFGSGYGDEEVDNTPLTEEVVSYEDGEMKFVRQSVIPASSIKGALSHRTCFHYNRLNEQFADEIPIEQHASKTGTNNVAVRQLFGMEASATENKEAHRGRVLLDDQYFEEALEGKIFNHVAIDRFTGGALEGALFSERVSHKAEVELDIWVERFSFDPRVEEAFEEALKDICKGLLPLGGMTTKGHGIFTGKAIKNEIKELYNYGLINTTI